MSGGRIHHFFASSDMFYLRTSLLARELALVPTRVVKLSTTTCLRSDRNRPKKSGDKGPEKNYMKKMIKKANKEDGDTIRTARSLVEKLKVYDRDRENQLTEAVDKDSMRYVSTVVCLLVYLTPQHKCSRSVILSKLWVWLWVLG